MCIRDRGGGARVKQVSISDNWQAMTGGKNAFYGQTYDYTTIDPETGESISSGVAANEPLMGRAESPLVKPIRYSRSNALSHNDFFLLEGPIGESFMPASQIIYSKVRVKDLQHTDITHNGTGRIEHEFYTAKDYPVNIGMKNHSTLDDRHHKLPGILTLGIVAYDYYTASQGYVIQLNDMHGKTKSTKVFAENQDKPLSETNYYYRTARKIPASGGNTILGLGSYQASQSNQLYNEGIIVVDKKAMRESARIGVEIDFVIDEQEEVTESVGRLCFIKCVNFQKRCKELCLRSSKRGCVPLGHS